MSTVDKFIETECRLKVTRGQEEGGNGELLLHRAEFLFGVMKNALERDSGNGYTTLQMSLMPLDCILNNL